MFQKKKHTRTKRNVCAIAFFDAAVHTEEKAQLFICSTFPLQSAVPANRNSHFGTVVWFDPDTRSWVDAVCPTGQQGRLVRFQRLVRLISVHQQDIFIRGCSEGKIRFDDLLQLGCLILLSL